MTRNSGCGKRVESKHEIEVAQTRGLSYKRKKWAASTRNDSGGTDPNMANQRLPDDSFVGITERNRPPGFPAPGHSTTGAGNASAKNLSPASKSTSPLGIAIVHNQKSDPIMRTVDPGW